MIRVLLMKFLEDCGAHRTHGLPLLARTWRGTLPGETFGRRHLILLQDLIEDLGGAARLSDVDAIGSLEGPFLTMVGVVGHFWEGSSLMRIRLASPFEIADAFLSTGASEGLSSCEFQGRSGDYLVVVREDALVVLLLSNSQSNRYPDSICHSLMGTMKPHNTPLLVTTCLV